MSGAGTSFWEESVDGIRERLGAPVDGWTSAQAAIELQRRGANRINAARGDSWTGLLARQFLNPIEIILVAATVLSGLLGDWTDATIILAILLISGALGFVEERNAGKAVAALIASVAPTCTIRRDGAPATLPLASVVPGDIAEVTAGDVVPGDCVILDARGLTVDESALSGESLPVEKHGVDATRAAAPTGRSCAAFLGTHVSSGSATLLVVRTGASTEFAGIAAALARKPPETGFERGMTRFGYLLTRVMAVLVVVIFIINLLLQRPPVDSALFSLALAVGLTPQLLPAIVAISLSVGARAMARERVIVRRLDAIEDIGAMTVLCSDKTGTMTQGRISLVAATDADGTPSARVGDIARLNAALQTGWRNPIDDALIASGAPPAGYVAVGEVPYDFLRKRQSVIAVAGDSPPVLMTKGALDDVLEVCDRARRGADAVPLAEAMPEIRAQFERHSGLGERVLGVSTRTLPAYRDSGDAREEEMVFEGLLCFADPVKPDASATLRQLAMSGVDVRMVTGDNRLVAAHVAHEVGLDAGRLWTGDEVDSAGDAALARSVGVIDVFCEMNPVQKERVIRAFRRGGHVVGYLGDGINDAPSLHAADVGLTVDTAVPVAKQAAAVVLLDKDLDVILDGVRQGRRTFANTMKYVYVNTSASFGNMLSMAFAAAILPFLPLLAGQILLVNLLSDLPAMTIASDAVDAEQVSRPQTWDVKLIRTYMIVFGVVSSAFDLVTFAVLRLGFHAAAPEFRTAWLVCSVLTEVGVLFILRTHGPFYRSRPGRGLVIASAVIVTVTVALPFVPGAQLVDLVPLPWPLVVVIAVTTLIYLLTTELVKRLFWARHERGTFGLTSPAGVRDDRYA